MLAKDYCSRTNLSRPFYLLLLFLYHWRLETSRDATSCRDCGQLSAGASVRSQDRIAPCPPPESSQSDCADEDYIQRYETIGNEVNMLGVSPKEGVGVSRGEVEDGCLDHEHRTVVARESRPVDVSPHRNSSFFLLS